MGSVFASKIHSFQLSSRVFGRQLASWLKQMDSADERKPFATDVFKWDNSSTRLLLTLYEDAIKDFGRVSHLKTKHQLWVHIIEEFSKYGYNLNPKQAQNRLVTLERSYKKRRSEPNRTHQSSISSLFDKEIEAIMDRKKNVLFGSDFNELLTENKSYYEDTEYVNMDHADVKSESISLPRLPVLDLNRWDPNSTKIFITAYLKLTKNSAKMRSFKTKSKFWQHVASLINAHGYEFTGKQTRNRFGTLIRAYRKYIEKRNSGIRSFFMFESEVREMLKHKVVMPDPLRDSDWDYDDDEDDVKVEDDFGDIDETEEVDVKLVSVDDANIDNVAVVSGSENSQSEFPQTTEHYMSPDPYSTDNHAIVDELRLLRKSESQFHQKMTKIEEEKLDLMRQNNILLKVLIEKLSKS